MRTPDGAFQSVGITQAVRYKAFHSSSKPKYSWPKAEDDPRRFFVYGLEGIPQDATHVYLVAGEPDVWIAQQAGFPAISFLGGEGTVKAEYFQTIKEHRPNINSITVIYDADDAGRSGAAKALQIGTAAGFTMDARDIGTLNSDNAKGYDLGDLWHDTRQDAAAFCEAVTNMAQWEPPATEQEATTPETPQARFNLISIAELMTRPDPTWLIHSVLMDGTNSILAAPHASFKSFLVLDMALCVASGRDWCGHKVRQGNVVFVCAEGIAGMKARIKAWCHDRNEEIPERFHFIDESVQIHDEAQRHQFLQSVVATLEDVKPVLIIFDTLSLCALGLEENSSRDMNQFMADVKRIQDETGAHVMLVHHTSKAGGTRGSSAIPGATQSEFEMKRERNQATLTCLKQKDGPEFKPMTFTSRKVEYDTFYEKSSLVLDYEGATTDAESLTASDTRIYNLLCEHFGPGGATSTAWWEVAKENGVTKPTFYRSVKNLVEKKQVDDGKGGKGGRGAIYRTKEAIEAEFLAQAEADMPESLKVSNSLNETRETLANPEVVKVSKSHTPLRCETNETNNDAHEKTTETKPKKKRKPKVSVAAGEPYAAERDTQ